jgi:hypothetical protein
MRLCKKVFAACGGRIFFCETHHFRNYLAPEGCDVYLRNGTDITKFFENIELMLTTRTDETLYSGIKVSPLGSSKTSGNFLLGFDRPDVALCLIIAKRDSFDCRRQFQINWYCNAKLSFNSHLS